MRYGGEDELTPRDAEPNLHFGNGRWEEGGGLVGGHGQLDGIFFRTIDLVSFILLSRVTLQKTVLLHELVSPKPLGAEERDKWAKRGGK